MLRNNSTGEEKVLHLTKAQQENDNHYHDENGVELEIIEKESLVEWFANHYKDFGANLEYVTDRSGEGTQFVKGFGGIGGILRWKVDFVEMSAFDDQGGHDSDDSDEESDDDDDDYGFDDGDFGF